MIADLTVNEMERAIDGLDYVGQAGWWGSSLSSLWPAARVAQERGAEFILDKRRNDEQGPVVPSSYGYGGDLLKSHMAYSDLRDLVDANVAGRRGRAGEAGEGPADYLNMLDNDRDSLRVIFQNHLDFLRKKARTAR